MSPAAPRPTLAALLSVSRGLALAGVLITAATARVVYAGEKEIALSTAALKAGDPHGAAEHARRAAGWYAPGAPHVRVAYDRLLALATTAEGLGDRETALFAWEGIRTAAIETRSLLTAHEAERDRADREIARLAAAAPRPPGTRTEPPAKIEREQLEALARDEAPRTLWVVGLVLSAITWITGAVWVVRRGVGATGRVDWAKALPGLVMIGAGVAIWLLSIWRA
ncbi:MAG: hypothetical protein ABI193_24830 [Minicystis sp.]